LGKDLNEPPLGFGGGESPGGQLVMGAAERFLAIIHRSGAQAGKLSRVRKKPLQENANAMVIVGFYCGDQEIAFGERSG
jgi:hypothetical protein